MPRPRSNMTRRSPRVEAASWRDEAACAGTFAAADHHEAQAKNGQTVTITESDHLILGMCPSCPVRGECALYALAQYAVDPTTVFGVWGGIQFGYGTQRKHPSTWPIDPNHIPRLQSWAKRLTERRNAT